MSLLCCLTSSLSSSGAGGFSLRILGFAPLTSFLLGSFCLPCWTAGSLLSFNWRAEVENSRFPVGGVGEEEVGFGPSFWPALLSLLGEEEDCP